MRVSRIQTRRQSRIGARISSILMAFARATPGYLDGEEYAIDAPRFPSQSGTVGVLVEEASTNLQRSSEDLTNATFWANTAVTVTANATTAPNGALTADNVVPTAAAGSHECRAPITVAAGALSFSVYAKASGYDWLRLGLTTVGNTWFNLAAGTVGTTAAGVTARIEAIGGGWYRCSVSHASAPLNPNAFVAPVNADAISSFTGDGTSGAFVWGVQVEAKGYPTTYIPTAGATAVTRNAETLTIPTQGLLTPSAGSVRIRAYVPADAANVSGAAQHRLFETDNGLITGRLLLYAALGKVHGIIRNAAGTSTTITWNGPLTAGFHTFDLVWKANRFSVWMDGTEIVASAAAGVPASLGANAYIGSGTADTFQWNDIIPWLATFGRDLTPAESANHASLPPDFTAHLDFTKGQLAVNQGHPWRLTELMPMLLNVSEGS